MTDIQAENFAVDASVMFGNFVIYNAEGLSNIQFLENDELALQEFQSNFQEPLVDNLLDLIEEHSRTTRSATEVAVENLLWVFNSSQHMFLWLVGVSGYRQMLAVATDPNTSCCRMLVAYWHNIFTAFLLILIACALFKSKATFEGFLTIIDLVFNGGKNLDWISPDISLSWNYMYYSQVTKAAQTSLGEAENWHSQIMAQAAPQSALLSFCRIFRSIPEISTQEGGDYLRLAKGVTCDVCASIAEHRAALLHCLYPTIFP